MGVIERLAELGIVLPQPPEPVANFTNYVFTNGFLYISGQGPIVADGTRLTGRMGKNISLEQGKAAARLAAINIIAVLQQALRGDWSRFDRFVKINAYVNSDKEFTKQPEVANGCSDLLVQIFGEQGRHARTAIGVCVLPFNILVEIEAIIALKDD